MRLLFFLLISGLTFGLAESHPTADLPSLAETIANDDNLSVFHELLDEAGLLELLHNGDGLLTVFAPTNEVFMRFTPEELAALRQDEEVLREILSYHVGIGRFTSSDILEILMIQTLQGEEALITYNQNLLFINDVLVTAIDVLASNGVIHVLGDLLFPPVPGGE